MLAVDPSLSVVGPAMNESPGPQRIGMVTYRRLDDLPAFAAGWAVSHRGEHVVISSSAAGGGLDPLCRVMSRSFFVDNLRPKLGTPRGLAPLKAGIAFGAFVHRQSEP